MPALIDATIVEVADCTWIENLRERPASCIGLLCSIVENIKEIEPPARPVPMLPLFLGRMLLRLQERQQFGQRLVRYFLRQEMPPSQRLAAHIGGAFSPDGQHVKHSVDSSALTPESKQRANNFAVQVLFVVFHIDGSTRPVIFAIRVDHARVTKAA